MSSRLTRHLDWGGGGLSGRSDLRLDVHKAPRERAAYLLKIAADVEHSIMVQYLFAAWSLGGPHLKNPGQVALAREWQATMLDIAQEEMGHLATVENLLTLIGGPPSFARQDYPATSSLYPFVFALTPLTKRSLARYVLAEMPSDAKVKNLGLSAEIDKIANSLGGSKKWEAHRVGILYDEIIDLFALPPSDSVPRSKHESYIASADIQASSLNFQVRPGEWKLRYDDLLILAASNREDAIAALRKISDQGEGTGLSSDLNQSHFGRFLQLHRAFPGERGWRPARRLAKNPTTDPEDGKARLIKNPGARKWAHLFNLRYKMLLMFLTHSFAIEGPASEKENTPRALLITWTFGEMYNLRSIAEVLMNLPLGDGSGDLAGPPFEMPVSLALPAREPDRWRLQRDMILASQQYVDELLSSRAGKGHEGYLMGLRSVNQTALQQAITMVGA